MPHLIRFLPSTSCVPGPVASVNLPPDGTKLMPGPNGAVNSGMGGPATPNTSWLSGGTNPGPNLATRVNVCVSPPTFLITTDLPATTSSSSGSKAHSSIARSSWSSAMNSSKVTSPLPWHVPGPTTALNVAGSHSSLMRTRPPSPSEASAIV